MGARGHPTGIQKKFPQAFDLEAANYKYPVDYYESMNSVLCQELVSIARQQSVSGGLLQVAHFCIDYVNNQAVCVHTKMSFMPNKNLETRHQNADPNIYRNNLWSFMN